MAAIMIYKREQMMSQWYLSSFEKEKFIKFYWK